MANLEWHNNNYPGLACEFKDADEYNQFIFDELTERGSTWKAREFAENEALTQDDFDLLRQNCMLRRNILFRRHIADYNFVACDFDSVVDYNRYIARFYNDNEALTDKEFLQLRQRCSERKLSADEVAAMRAKAQKVQASLVGAGFTFNKDQVRPKARPKARLPSELDAARRKELAELIGQRSGNGGSESEEDSRLERLLAELIGQRSGNGDNGDQDVERRKTYLIYGGIAAVVILGVGYFVTTRNTKKKTRRTRR